jgi:diadenosine tetraphosphatase ApaH/serine/threonine PP2A family protein phosphatase
VLAGDLTAKGPDSQGVVQLARERGALAVLGNHDARVLEFLEGRPAKGHHAQVAHSLTPADAAWLQALPLWLDLPEQEALVVHGGLLPGVPLAHQPRHLLLNLRSFDPRGEPTTRVEGGVPWASRWPGPRRVLFGHDALRGLQRHPHALGLDTGCVYGRALTGVWLDDDRVVQVQARKAWSAPEGG